eukprot:7416439-Pyramimonas_sp.AAC.1
MRSYRFVCRRMHRNAWCNPLAKEGLQRFEPERFNSSGFAGGGGCGGGGLGGRGAQDAERSDASTAADHIGGRT